MVTHQRQISLAVRRLKINALLKQSVTNTLARDGWLSDAGISRTLVPRASSCCIITDDDECSLEVQAPDCCVEDCTKNRLQNKKTAAMKIYCTLLVVKLLL